MLRAVSVISQRSRVLENHNASLISRATSTTPVQADVNSLFMEDVVGMQTDSSKRHSSTICVHELFGQRASS